MRAQKNNSKMTLTGKQVSALIACIVAIAVLSLMIGYISGRMFNKETVEIEKKVEATDDVFGGLSPRHLDPDDVEKETTFDQPVVDSFSFHKKLGKETDPANKPLPKSSVPAESKMPETATLKKPAPPTVKKRAPQKTAKVARKLSKPKIAKRAPAEPKSAGVKRLTIQVGSFKHRNEAQALVKKLGKKGYRAYVVPFKLKGETWSRVRVGIFDSTISAKKTARKLERDLKLPTLLVSYQGGK